MYLLFILAHSWEMYKIVQFHWGHIHYIGCLSVAALIPLPLSLSTFLFYFFCCLWCAVMVYCVVFNVFVICIMYVLSCLRLCHVLDLTLRLVLGLWFCPMYFLYFLNLYLWYGFGLPSYPLFSSYNNEDMGYVMLCNAFKVMHPSPPHIHAHITLTPYS